MLAYFKTIRHNAGYYAGSTGVIPASGDKDYVAGYKKAVALLQESAMQLEEATTYRRKADEYVRRAHNKNGGS